MELNDNLILISGQNIGVFKKVSELPGKTSLVKRAVPNAENVSELPGKTSVVKSAVSNSDFITFEVDANDTHCFYQQDRGMFPEIGDGVTVRNSGRYPVTVDYDWAAIWYAGGWKNAKRMVVGHGESQYMSPLSNITYHCRMVINNSKQDHVVTGSYRIGGDWSCFTSNPRSDKSLYAWDPTDPCNNMKTIVMEGVSKIPYVGSFLSVIIGMFWTTGQVDLNNLWQKCLNEIQLMIDQALLKQLQDILAANINETAKKIDYVNQLIEANGFAATKDNYMDLIGSYLVGLEENFKRSLDSETGRTAYSILPLFSTTVSLQMQYYGFGYDYKKEFGLTDQELNEIKIAMDSLYKDASQYVKDMATWVDDDAYDYGGDMFNNVMGARGFVGIHGFEHLKLWDKIHHDRSANVIIDHLNVVSYSQRVGIATYDSDMLASGTPDEIGQPLCPAIVGDHRNRIKSIDGWASKEMYYHNRVGGFKVTYENGNTVTVGINQSSGTKPPKSINFNGAYITKIESSFEDAQPYHALNFIRFHLSDKRTYVLGDPNCKVDEKKDFELDGHFICGIFADYNDQVQTDPKACCFCVAYQMIDNEY